jgi:hypothetical protein
LPKFACLFLDNGYEKIVQLHPKGFVGSEFSPLPVFPPYEVSVSSMIEKQDGKKSNKHDSRKNNERGLVQVSNSTVAAVVPVVVGKKPEIDAHYSSALFWISKLLSFQNFSHHGKSPVKESKHPIEHASFRGVFKSVVYPSFSVQSLCFLLTIVAVVLLVIYR